MYNVLSKDEILAIIPGGGLSNDGLRFVRSRKKFLIPVKAISKKFKDNFLDLLKQAYIDGEYGGP